MRLQGRVAAITGGALGIGRATARLFAAEGAAVVLGDVKVEEAEAVAREIAQAGGRALAVGVDVGDAGQVQAFVDRAVAELGRLDVMFANAGIAHSAPFLEHAEAQWHRVLRVNLTGVFLCCQIAARQMVAQGGGRIITTASINGFRGVENLVGYNAAKAGVIELTKTMAVELARHGITVNAIAPAQIDTRLTRSLLRRRQGAPRRAHPDGPIRRGRRGGEGRPVPRLRRRQLRDGPHPRRGRRLSGRRPLVERGDGAMITRFSTLYVGHIELERCGLAGVPADDRRYSNARLTETFDTAAALARAADELGYETLWLAEHHFQHEGYECIPNIPLLAVDLAHRTRRVKIGCAFNIVPTWHPLRLAEDYATADILTGGRVVFGVGRGYHSREVETFGNPMLDGEANRALFEEQVEIILKAFREESFAHRGTHYTLPPEVPYRGYPLKEITLVPRPTHQPVEVWQPIVSGSARSLDFMARHGIKGVISSTAETVVERWLRDYQEAGATARARAAARRGRDPRLPHVPGRDRGAGHRAGPAVLRGARQVHGAARHAALQRGARVGGGGAAGPVRHRGHAGKRRPQPELAVRPARRHRRLPQVAGGEVPRAWSTS